TDRTLTATPPRCVAALVSTTAEDSIMDFIVEADSRVGCLFFTMSEDNVRKAIGTPWFSFCSDSQSLAPEGVFLKSNIHPRAYGSFARLLGKYVRDERILPLEEAVRRLSAFPAENLGLERRGRLIPGNYADVVAFDPNKTPDHPTSGRPHHYDN